MCFSAACSKESKSSPYLCLDATYIVALLKEGFDFKDNRRLTVSIRQTGTILHSLSACIPSGKDSLIKTMGDLAVPFGVKEEVLVSLRVVSFKGPPREPFGYCWGVIFDRFVSQPSTRGGGEGGRRNFFVVTSCFKSLARIENGSF